MRERVGATEFLGYETVEAQGRVVALIVDGNEVDKVATGTEVLIVTNQTPFYGESGGQVGDEGAMFAPDLEVRVTIRKSRSATCMCTPPWSSTGR